MKRFLVVITAFISFFYVSALSVSANNVAYSNPSIDEIKEIITDAAMEHNVPPEIVKAIAFDETGYKQFKDGEPNISDDGGIGIMQVTPDNISIPVDDEKLKTDIEYNINIAVQVLRKKWELSYLPEMNDQDNQVLENWYFPITAYNGLSKVNDPEKNPNNTYQKGIYNRIEGSSFIYWNESYFDFPAFDIRYEGGQETMKFPDGVNYTTDNITPSQQMYREGDIVYVDPREGSVNLRHGSVDSTDTTRLLPYTPLEIISDPVESPNVNNDFSYYLVKGVDVEGFVSSAYLKRGNKDITFSDPMDDERAAALAFLSMNDYVNGKLDGSFGSREQLKREHVAAILDRILNLSMPADYEMQADDVPFDNPYYKEIAKAEYNGYLGVGGKIRPKEFLTRTQMASVMTRAFDDYYEEPVEEHEFMDQDELWEYEVINKIYHNNVTIADPFRPRENITRSQFALFIYRTMVDK